MTTTRWHQHSSFTKLLTLHLLASTVSLVRRTWSIPNGDRAAKQQQQQQEQELAPGNTTKQQHTTDAHSAADGFFQEVLERNLQCSPLSSSSLAISSSSSCMDDGIFARRMIPMDDDDGAAPALSSSFEPNTQHEPRIPNTATWARLYQAYQRVVLLDNNCDDNQNHASNSSSSSSFNDVGGFVVPFEVQHVPGKGRGVFSKAHVSKGDIVFSGLTATFYSQDQWRKFLSQLQPPSLARDVVSWAYVVDIDDGSGANHVVMLDLQEGSLVNHGDTCDTNHTRIIHDDVNANNSSSIVCPPASTANIIEIESEQEEEITTTTTTTTTGPTFLFHLQVMAARDIAPGEEFLTDYRLFHIQNHTLTWFDEIRQQLFYEDFGFDILSLQLDN